MPSPKLEINQTNMTKGKGKDYHLSPSPARKDYQIKPFSTRKIDIIGLVTLTALTLLSFGFLIYPSAAKTGQLKDELNIIEAELNQKLNLGENLEELIEKYQKDLSLAEEVVFTDRDIATFLENFSDFARQANMVPVSIKSLKIEAVPVRNKSKQDLDWMGKKKKDKQAKAKEDMEKELPGLLMQPMKIMVRGEYPDLINFLISLEKYKQLITINDLDIGIAKEEYPILEASFIVRLYKMGSSENREDKEV